MEPPPQEPEEEPDVHACRILVVDDDEAWRDLVADSLRAKGYDVGTAEDGDQAVAMLRKEKFHVAVMDIMMPRKDGIEAMRLLKGLDSDIEVILVTGLGSEAVASEVVRRGAYAYLVKPFDLMELEALLPGVYEKLSLKSLVGLYETTRTLFASVQLKDLLPDLMVLARKILGADDASVMLASPDGELSIAASSGLDVRLLGRVQIAMGAGVAGRVAQWRTGVMINGPLRSDPRFADLPSREDVRYSLVYPILLKDDLVGILCANRKPGKARFIPQDLRHAAIFCSMIAQAIENAKLYERLEAARREAVQANELKDELMYMTTHDLKSPLHIIQGYTEIIQDSRSEDRMKSVAVTKIFKAVQDMLAYVNQMLRKAQVESADFRVERQPTAVSEVVDACVEDFDIIARKKDLALAKDDGLPPGYEASVDPTALREIVSNLIGNAIKYSEAGGKVAVALRKEGAELVLSVSDTGPGIAPEDQERVFHKFQRGRSARGEGAGFGLAIVRRLAQAHGGRVTLASAPGKGSEFKVLLPEA